MYGYSFAVIFSLIVMFSCCMNLSRRKFLLWAVRFGFLYIYSNLDPVAKKWASDSSWFKASKEGLTFQGKLLLPFSNYTSLSRHQILVLAAMLSFLYLFQRKLSAFVRFLSSLHDSGCVEGKASDLYNAYPQVKGLQDSTDTRYKALEKQLAALEERSTGAAPDVDTQSD